MKNKFKFFGIIAIIAVIGFGLTACSDGSDDGGGGDGIVIVSMVIPSEKDICIDFNKMIRSASWPLASLTPDFKVFVDGNEKTVSEVTLHIYPTYPNIWLTLDTFKFVNSSTYNVKVIYTANSARKIEYSSNKYIGSFTEEKQIKADF